MFRTLANILRFVIHYYSLILFIRAIISWTNASPYQNQFVRIIYQITEPYLKVFREHIKPVRLGQTYLDLSFIVAYLALVFGGGALVNFLAGLGS